MPIRTLWIWDEPHITYNFFNGQWTRVPSKSVGGNCVLKINKTGGGLITKKPKKGHVGGKTSCFIWNSTVGASEKLIFYPSCSLQFLNLSSHSVDIFSWNSSKPCIMAWSINGLGSWSPK